MNAEQFIKSITVKQFADLPVRTSQRKCTDVCCTIFGALFVITMIIAAVVNLSINNIFKWTFPNDSSGRTCGHDLVNYPYLYWTSPSNINNRLCVNKCPTAADERLSCSPTAQLGCSPSIGLQSEVQLYDTKLDETRLGLFCMPVSPLLRERIISNTGMSWKFQFLGSYDAIKLGLLTSIILGVMLLLLIQCMPTAMVYVSIAFGGLAFLGLAVILILFDHTELHTYKIIKYCIVIALILIGLGLIISLLIYGKELKIWGIFLKYSGRFISSNLQILLVMPIFLILTFGLVALFVFQLLAFWSTSHMVFSPSLPYYQPQPTTFCIIMTILNFIFLYWGFSFLNEASNFINSGEAVEWYMRGNHGSARIDTIRNLFCYHWGSVVAGSFMLGFLTVPDMLFDLLKPSRINQGGTGCYGSCFHTLAGWIEPLFELVRSESMAYINMTGVPYCNASRYCEFICENSSLFRGNSHSVNRFYRLGSHGLISCISTIVAVQYMHAVNGSVSLYAWLFVFVATSFIVTTFISLHQDAATGIMITLLAEQQVNGSINYVRAAPQGLVRELIIL